MSKLEIVNLEKINHCYIKEKNVYYLYFLYLEDEIVYIGQTNLIEGRISAHTSDKLFTSYKYITYENITRKEILEIERFHINHYKPIFNDSVSNSIKDEEKYFHRKSNKLLKTGINYTSSTLEKVIKENGKPNQVFTVVYDGKDIFGFYSKLHEADCFMKNDKIVKCKQEKEFRKIYEYLMVYLNYPIKIQNNNLIINKNKIMPDTVKFKSGKYKGHYFNAVVENNPGYINWIFQNVPSYRTSMLTF